jgi:uncharacterized protein (TIGR02270 family)
MCSQGEVQAVGSEHQTEAGVIPAIYAQHLQEFAFLWGQRQAAVRSPDYTPRDLAQLQQRLDAHLDGLLTAGHSGVSVLVQELTGDDPLTVFTAAYALLRLELSEAAEKAVDALLQAQPPQVDVLRQAFCHGPIDLVAERLEAVYRTGPAALAATAAEIFAYHGRLGREPGRLAEFFAQPDPAVRGTAWRIATLIGRGGS